MTGALFIYSVGLEPNLPNPMHPRLLAHHRSRAIKIVLYYSDWVRFGFGAYIYQSERGQFEFWAQEREPETGKLLDRWTVSRGKVFERSPTRDDDWVSDEDWALVGNALAFWPVDRDDFHNVSSVPERHVWLSDSPGHGREIA